MFEWDHCENCHDARKARTEAAADAQRHAEALREARAEIVRLKIRAQSLAEDVSELEVRLRLAKSSAIAAAHTARAALERLALAAAVVVVAARVRDDRHTINPRLRPADRRLFDRLAEVLEAYESHVRSSS